MSTKKEPESTPTELTEAEKEQLKEELRKTEEEITTLRQVIAARMKHAADLKQKLGISAWQELQQDVSEGIKAVKGSEVYHVTNDFLTQATDAISSVGEKVTSKFGQLRSSNAFKSFEEKVGGAYSSVKGKISGATPESPVAEEKNP